MSSQTLKTDLNPTATEWRALGEIHGHMDHRKINHSTCDSNSLKTHTMFANLNAVKLSSKLQDTALLIMSNFSSSFFSIIRPDQKKKKKKTKKLKFKKCF